MPDAPAVDAPPAAPAAPVEPAAPVAGTPAPPAAPEAPAAPAAADSLPDDPAALKTMIADLRKENGSARTNAKAQAAEDARNELVQSIGKTLGLVKDDAQLDPAVLTSSLTAAQTEAKQARVELAVFRAAGGVQGDPLALLDSTSFLKSLESVDPADTAAVQAAITAAMTANPRLGAATEAGPKVPAPLPGQGAAASGVPGFDAQIAEATAAGNHQLAIALKQAKQAAKTP